MEIILKEDILGLGYKNDIVTVKSGYGRNYIIPKGKGIIASVSAKKVLAENLKQQAHKIAAIKDAAQANADKLNGVSLEIAVKVSATGVTYGSVNAAHISDELKKKGFDIDRRIIAIKDIKNVGDYVAVVNLHKEVSVEIPVKVVSEDAPNTAKAEIKVEEEAPTAE